MKVKYLFLIAAIALQVTPHAFAKDADVLALRNVPSIKENPMIVKFTFGGLHRNAAGQVEMTESNKLRRSQSDGFGWALKLSPSKQIRRWKEALYLPAAAADWRTPPTGIRYEDEGRIAIREGLLDENEEILSRLWSISASDVAGSYRLAIFLEGEAIKIVNFTLAP